ncbi:MAG: hypothetical protein KC912_06335 [Proteobacteria bacterium]|nr:hypothetical protein [Pseudomonadota bacterium]
MTEFLPILTTMATLSLGWSNNAAEQNLYVHGSSDLYVSERVSLRGDAYWFAGEQHQQRRIIDNHSVLAGAAFHFGKGRFDPFVAMQPGVSFTRSEFRVDGERTPSNWKVTPVASATMGARYFVSPNFHFFTELRQMAGTHLSDDPRTIGLAETRVSFGLGAQLGRTGR